MLKRDNRLGFRCLALVVVGLFHLSTLTPAQGQLRQGASKASVELVSSVKSVIPGMPFELGLYFKLEDGWHIYWKNPGDSGLPPQVTWKLPEGFKAGELQFPAPKRHESGDASFTLTTYVIEGEPLLPVTITPPENIDLQQVTIEVELVYLYCKEQCLRDKTTLKIELPVGIPGAEPEPANEDLFRLGRRALPKTSSAYVRVRSTTGDAPLKKGARFNLNVHIEVVKGHHIQSNKPLQPLLVKSDIILERTEGLTFGEPEFPKGEIKSVKSLGKISVYTGGVPVRVPVEVDEDLKAPVRVAGVLLYQACNETGTCFPPDAVSIATDIGIAGGGAFTVPATAPVAAPATIPTGDDGENTKVADKVTGDSVPDKAGVELQVDGGGMESETANPRRTGQDPLGFLGQWGLAGLLIGCFVYGLALNATPCVLPLLSIKVLGFVHQAHESRKRTLALGLAFGVGVMIFFVALGFLAATGKNILQYPVAVVALSTVVMALALSMLGVYNLQVPQTAAKLDATIQQEGIAASFGKGALAPVLGFACTGPLMAGVFGWAVQQPQHIAFLSFLAAGLGMAFPYMLLGANPNWLSFLPKPGHWMITFERIMGFLLLGMVLWLIAPLVAHVGSTGLLLTLGFMVAVAMSCWIIGQIKMTMSGPVRWKYRVTATTVAAATGVLVFGWAMPKYGAQTQGPRVPIGWKEWSPEAVTEAVNSGKTVFVDFTAAYCTNCKLNKARAIKTPEVEAKLRAFNIVAFQGDYTKQDARITQALREFNRPGVPLNLVYPAGKPDQPIVLPPIFSKKLLLEKLDQAGPSRSSEVVMGS